MHLAGMTEQSLIERGVKQAHARALVSWFAGRATRPRAADAFDDQLPRSEAVRDPDGTVRFAVHLDEKTIVETVLIEHASRRTVCLSSQAGCARGCVFCETGRLGLQRNLTAAEIVSQYAIVARWLNDRPRNVVFMGMGEPLDNLAEVLEAIEVLTERAGFAVPERRVTVSTVGIVPKMAELYARTKAQVAVSLHALEPPVRKALLPVARKWSLERLRETIATAPRTVLLQWTLIHGVNDAPQDADALARFCNGLDVRVNLIPLNPGPIPEQRAPPLEECRAFQKRLADAGVRAMLRMPHGQKVGGACGQLAGALRARASASAR
ncbi:MAG: 23S rRNA (adenine(2503)-C(2))-methyltransferase RlmN [Myxococcales bacterium]|nr:23S rRNA (adenine(2503)-C(2))-methyltransferase RlmN [Myxococcales bacterium]